MVELLRLEMKETTLYFSQLEHQKYRILNDGRFKTSETSYVQFTGAIHSSETRYYKLINYTSGYMVMVSYLCKLTETVILTKVLVSEIYN